MADVARAAGVSKQTVSRVVNKSGRTSPLTVARVEKLIAELGYRPSGIARSLATNATRTMGLVIPALDNPYHSEIAQGAEHAAWREGYSLVLCNVFNDPERERTSLHLLEDRGVDAVIIETPHLRNADLFELLALHKAAVVIGREVPSRVAGNILIDDAAGIALALEHLLGLGRSSIAMLPGTEHYASGRIREEAFRRFLLDADRFDPNLVLACEPTAAASFEATLRLVEAQPHLDSLVCFNDIVAAGALRALRHLGIRVPEDVAVIGHDDIPMAELLCPSLTTLRVSKNDIGVNAVRMVLDRLGGANRNTQVVLKPELVVRESTVPTPAEVSL